MSDYKLYTLYFIGYASNPRVGERDRQIAQEVFSAGIDGQDAWENYKKSEKNFRGGRLIAPTEIKVTGFKITLEKLVDAKEKGAKK